MKTTLEIDDELYREAKAHASLTGRKMKDLVTEGLRLALIAAAHAPAAGTASAARQLETCFTEADLAMQAAPAGSTARTHLDLDRNRLES